MNPSTFSPAVFKNAVLLAVALLVFQSPRLKADTLSDNLSTVTADTEPVEGDTWVAASFATNASAYRLESAILLLASTAPGTPELDLYSDAGQQPASMLAAFTSPLFFISGIAPATFTSSGSLLSPNSTYWLVLKAPSGRFEWAWTDDDTGTGVGFTHVWGFSDDAGASWSISDTQPMQFSVTASPAAAVPEPASLVLFLLPAIALLRVAVRGNRISR